MKKYITGIIISLFLIATTYLVTLNLNNKKITTKGFGLDTRQVSIKRNIDTDKINSNTGTKLSESNSTGEDMKDTSVSSAKKVSDGVILLGEKAYYYNLTDDQKLIMNDIQELRRKDFLENMKKTDDDPEIYKDDIKIDNCLLKYYDKNIVIFGCPTVKPGTLLSIYDRKTLSIASSGRSLFYNSPLLTPDRGFIESKEYLISISNLEVTFFKPGMTKVETLDGSKLTKNESYMKDGDAGGNEYEYSFNEKTKTLKVSIFETSSAYPALKLREVSFVLP